MNQRRIALWGGGVFVMLMLVVWFMGQAPEEVAAWWADLWPPSPAPVVFVPPPYPPPPPRRTGACLGLTWTLLRQVGFQASVGPDARSDAQRGDTACAVELPVLCTNGRDVAVKSPVPGAMLESRATGDSLCVQRMGDGWKMVGANGAGVNLQGELPAGMRFWTASEQGLANPWN